jgi:tetratricopeptide (TPR) repeat protein
MIHQSEGTEALGVPVMSLKLELSDEARASLEAVRVAQEDARRRAREQTRQARIWFALGLGIAGTLGVFGPRVVRARRARAQVAAVAPAVAPPAAVAAAPEMAPPAPSPAAPVAVAPSAASAELAAGCDRAAIHTTPWRISAEACAQAFEADPHDASLALAIAQSEHAHSHLPESAKWAQRALAIDPNAAEAYVIIARARAKAGDLPEAREAYRHYLELAPRGWHHAEARAALRRESKDRGSR